MASTTKKRKFSDRDDKNNDINEMKKKSEQSSKSKMDNIKIVDAASSSESDSEPETHNETKNKLQTQSKSSTSSKARPKFGRAPIPVDEKETEIEKLLFGANSAVFGSTESDEESDLSEDTQDHEVSSDDGELSPEFVLGAKSSKSNSSTDQGKEPAKKKKKVSETESVPMAAWEDEDDMDDIVPIMRSARSRRMRKDLSETELRGDIYEERLRDKFVEIQAKGSGVPDWAKIDPDDLEEEDESLKYLKSTMPLVSRKSGESIEADNIQLGQMLDANKQEVSNAVVQAVAWHPNGNILLTGGFDKTLRLFDIDGIKNSKLQSAFFADLPINSAKFSHDGNSVFVSGLNNSFYSYDILSGKVDRIDRILGAPEKVFKQIFVSPDDKILIFLGGQGRLHIVSNKTKAWITTLKMNGAVITGAFNHDGTEFWTAGASGEIYVWEMSSFTCIRRFRDEGATVILSIALSSSGEYLAAGQDSGVVNIYRITDEDFKKSKNPKPIKAVMNLTTAVNILQFNHDSQLLAIASGETRNALRLIHLPTCRVYQNWPNERTPLGRVASLAFSPEGGWLAIGNVRGNVRLFKIHHYHPSSAKVKSKRMK